MSELGEATSAADMKRARRLLNLYGLRAKVDAAIADAEAETRRRRLGQRNAARCGTVSGYAHHRRQLKEPACDACKLAHAAAERAASARRREGAA